ncbi:MAG TPA: hypothetical protein PKC72_10970 [Chitinophagaceae bacterium]|nr:hypothetical protein [Chitinophagaceae bacterium]
MGNPRLYKTVPLYTKREPEIIRLICRGYGNKEMSDKLRKSSAINMAKSVSPNPYLRHCNEHGEEQRVEDQ